MFSVCFGCATEATLWDGFFEGDDVVGHISMSMTTLMMYTSIVSFSSVVYITPQQTDQQCSTTLC